MGLQKTGNFTPQRKKTQKNLLGRVKPRTQKGWKGKERAEGSFVKETRWGKVWKISKKTGREIYPPVLSKARQE